MERKLCVRSLCSSNITALAHQPIRREIVAGFEDGSIRCWEQDSGKLVSTASQHKGWITDLLFWSDWKTLFSCSIDYTIIQWSSAGVPYHTIELGSPVYSLLWNVRRDCLLCGRDGYITLLIPSGKSSASGNPLLSRKETRVDGHSGVVRCLASVGSKVYSAGHDCRLIVWEVSAMDRDFPLRAQVIHSHAHNAGISTLVVAKDSDSSTWIATGSFDNKCKLWTGEGKLMFSLQCSGPVTGLAFVPLTGILWVAAGHFVSYYEPKSGECITEVVSVLNSYISSDKNRVVQGLKFIPETNEVLGWSNLKEVIQWSYSPSCSVCVHQSPSQQAHVESIAYTNKRPILMFTVSYDGQVTKWERQQLNPFMYSTEQLPYKDMLSQHLRSEAAEWNLVKSVFGGEAPVADINNSEAKEATQKMKHKARKRLLEEEDFRGFVLSLFVEDLDYLVASSLDGRIMVWGYDLETVAVLSELQRTAQATPITTPTDAEDPVINRVAGFKCLHVLNGHTGPGSGLEVVSCDNKCYLLSTGWDCCVCVWDLISGKLLAKVEHSTDGDDIITSLAYSPTSNCLAYSMTDSTVTIRHFSTKQSELKVKAQLLGHTEEVTQVRWNDSIVKWVTGSADGTIRIWSEEGGECEMLVSIKEPVSLITIDKTHGHILAAVGSNIRIYNSNLELLQVCRGHQDNVRALVHVPENSQYVSSGWDKTVRWWPEYQPRVRTQ